MRSMAKITISVPDEDLQFFEAAAKKSGLKVSPFLVRAARVGALWEDANRARTVNEADDLARAESLLMLDAEANADARGHGHAA